MCTTLAANCYTVCLVVADGLGDESINNVSIIDIGGRTGGRISRMTSTMWCLYKKAKELDTDIYHFHDPELIPIGLLLQTFGKKVIYDAHEDTKNQILIKPYLNTFSSTILSKLYEWFEGYSLSRFSGIITATGKIMDNLTPISKNIQCIKNYPIDECILFEENYDYKKNIIYIGGLSRERGIIELLDSLSYIDPTINIDLCGKFFEGNFKEKVMNHPNWHRVFYHGFVNQEFIIKLLNKSLAGMVTLHPTLTYVDSLPVKLFEYAKSGVPVICSNFPKWLKIFSNYKFSLFVDPLNPKEIAHAINKLYKNQVLQEQFSKNARTAFLENFNWDSEELKLLEFYKRI